MTAEARADRMACLRPSKVLPGTLLVKLHEYGVWEIDRLISKLLSRAIFDHKICGPARQSRNQAAQFDDAAIDNLAAYIQTL
jgi:hypothetical protein